MGCYVIRTNVWGTKSAAVFVRSGCLVAVLSDAFWPDLIKCRKSKRSSPSRCASAAAYYENDDIILVAEAVSARIASTLQQSLSNNLQSIP